MSKISTIYDKIVSKLSALYPTASGYFRLPNCLNVEENPKGFLVKGYGFEYIGCTLEGLEFNALYYNHSFKFVVSRESLVLDTDFADHDVKNKEILEDVKSLTATFYDQNLIDLAEADVENINIDNISGMQILADEKQIRYVEVDITITLKENI